MAASRSWVFKARFRTRAFGWRGSRLACQRLKEALGEIRKAAKTDPIAAGEGAVCLMERLWPALQNVDSSSGALGNAVYRTLRGLVPLLIEAPCERATREKWLDRLYQALCDDGVGYLSPVEDRWGELCEFPELAREWADRILPLLRDSWANGEKHCWVRGSVLCLSCLLATERYDDLRDVLDLRTYPFWPYDKFWAEALARQGLPDEAVAYAESRRRDPYEQAEVSSFCEGVLMKAGRREEAYRRYGLSAVAAKTYRSVFRQTAAKYAEKDPKDVLLDLIEARGEKGKWFAAAKDAGYLDVALDCAATGDTAPSTLLRAARDFREVQPLFAAQVAFQAIRDLLLGKGYEVTTRDIVKAYEYLVEAAARADRLAWVDTHLRRLVSCDPLCYDLRMKAALTAAMQEGQP